MAFDPNGVVGKRVQQMAGSRVFRAVGPKVVPPIDNVLHKVTKGRFLLSRLMMPSAVLTTTGRKSGVALESAVAAFKFDEAIYVVGSNFGKTSHPAWSWNLIANPHHHVSWQGQNFDAQAVLLEGQDRAAAWTKLIQLWPLYEKYEQASGRQLRVFRIDPA